MTRKFIEKQISSRWFWFLVLPIIIISWDGPALAAPNKIETVSRRHLLWTRKVNTAIPTSLIEIIVIGHLWGIWGRYDPIGFIAYSISKRLQNEKRI